MQLMLSRPAVLSSAVCLAALATFVSRDVAACTCPASKLLSPRGGASDVPLNAVIIFQTYGSPGVLHDVTHDVDVPVTMEPFAGRPQTWLIRPNDALAANSIFEVAPGPAGPGNPMAQFTTGSATDDAPPAYDGFRGFRTNIINLLSPSLPCRSSCWGGDSYRRLYFDYAPPPSDSELLLAEIRREPAGGAPITETVPLFRNYTSDWPQLIATGSCFIGVPSFNAGENVCARVIAFDMAGHRSDASPEICSRAEACAPKIERNTCFFVDECVPESDPTSDAGEGDAAQDGAGGTDAPRVDAPPHLPPEDNDRGGCTISHGVLRGASMNPRLAFFAAALVLLRRRRRSD